MSDMWIRDQWDEAKGRSIAIRIRKHLESYKSNFQKIDVYETECFGRMLVLDGVIMLTEEDEHAYHEMIAHVAMSTHPSPRKVLIIGGGDGGTAREVLKHAEVEEVDVCEIDNEVIKVSQKYFSKMASSFDDPKVKVHNDDGARFVRARKGHYDIIIVDSSDPIGPAEVLFKEDFYRSINEALAGDGIAVTQSESMYYDKDIIRMMFKFNKKIFPELHYFYTLVPTYPSGTIGFSFCSKKYNPISDMRIKDIKGLKYYNKDMHIASFALPNFLKSIVE